MTMGGGPNLNPPTGVASRLLRGNYGQRRAAFGGRWTNIATLSLLPGETATVTVRTLFAPFPQRAGAPAGVNIPKVRIRITSGVLGVRSIMYTLAGTPKTVSGTNFYVEAQIFYDENGTVPAPGNVTTDVTAYFSDGHGQDLQPTSWVKAVFGAGPPPLLVGSFLTLLEGPGKLKQVQGYNHSTKPTWLMFFDWPIPGQSPLTAPTNAQVPFLTIPVPGSPPSPGVDPFYSWDGIEGKKEFTYGVALATSSTGDVYTFDAGGQVANESEIYQGDNAAQ